MRAATPFGRRWIAPTIGVLLGTAAAGTGITLSSATAGPTSTGAPAVFESTHLPPLLMVSGERVELAYDVHCAATEADAEAGCDVRGTAFVRAIGDGPFEAVPLERRSLDGMRQFAAVVPDRLYAESRGVEYYAAFDSGEVDKRVTVPAGGAAAPHVSWRLEEQVDVELGRHAFGGEHRLGSRVASARWGDGPTEVGLEQGRNLGPIGASSFDVDSRGNVLILDQAHRRLLSWRKGARAPSGVPVSINGTLADLATANDGSVFVLESTASPGRHPLTRRFDDGGRELEAVETAEPAAVQIRMGPGGPVVLGRPSHHWTPVMVDGTPASLSQQLGRGRPGRRLGGGLEIVVFRYENELRIALVADRSVTRSWRVTSDTPLAEVQLAEPLGQRLVIVVRAYNAGTDEFVVLILDREGLADRFSLDSADWAETAPFGRFRLVGRSLYRLGSTPAGAFVDRFALEVR